MIKFQKKVDIKISMIRWYLFIVFSLFIFQFSTAQQSGYLKFEFNTDSAHLVLDNDVMGVMKIASGDSIRLPIGTHVVEVYTPFDVRYLEFPNVSSGTTTIVRYLFQSNNVSSESLYANYAAAEYWNANYAMQTDSDTDIYFDGEFKGTGFAFLDFKPGVNTIEFKNPYHKTSYVKIKYRNNKPLTLNEYFVKPIRKLAYSASLVPGASQIYKKQYTKGTLIFSGTSLFAYLWFRNNKKYSLENRDFINLTLRYNSATTESEALRLGDLVDKQHKILTTLDNKRQVYLSITMISYIYNIIDAFISKPNGGYYEAKPLNFYFSNQLTENGFIPRATLQMSFKP